MKCRHCGKEYDDSFSYCPYCAEPKPHKTIQVTVDDKVKEVDNTIWFRGFVVFLASLIPTNIIGFVIAFLVYLFSPVEDMYDQSAIYDKAVRIIDGEKIFLIAVGVSFVIGLIYVISWKLRSHRSKMISVQFGEDQKSICPVCGSHSIALGRKGYDWEKGFWYRIFNFKGGHYLAGIDSRRVTAHCQNCGHSWLTNEEWMK